MNVDLGSLAFDALNVVGDPVGELRYHIGTRFHLLDLVVVQHLIERNPAELLRLGREHEHKDVALLVA